MKHFTEEQDAIILNEVIANPPFHLKYGKLGAAWKAITEKVSAALNRSITTRSIKDRVNVLLKAFKQREAAALAASGTAETPGRNDGLLGECLTLMEENPEAANGKTPQRVGPREVALTQLKDKPEVSEWVEAADVSLEPKSRSSKRSQDAALTDILGEYVAVRRKESEEKMVLKRSELEFERVKVQLEQKRGRRDFELRAKQQAADNEFRARQQAADLESQKRRDEKERVMMEVFAAFVQKKDSS